MSKHILVEKVEGILTLVMNRPDKKNALTDEMYGILADEIEAAQTDSSVRVILVRAEGDMFTSGNDIADFASAKPDDGELRNVTRFINVIGRGTKPMIAAVQGSAVGVGTTMLLHCDYVLLGEDAKLVTPFVKLGLVPEAASTLLMPARIGYLRAYSLLALAEPMEAQEALATGLANAVVPNAELASRIEAVAAKIARLPLGSLQATKKLMRNGEDYVARMEVESAEFAQRLQSPEAREAFMAFMQKREPDFTQFG